MDVLTKKIVKTRKPHTCFGCERKFPSGTTMEFSTIADGGTVHNSYLCQTCLEVIANLVRESGYFEYCYGDLRDEALELEAKLKQEDNI